MRSVYAGYFFNYSDRYGDGVPLGTWTHIAEPGVMGRSTGPLVIEEHLITEAVPHWSRVKAVWVSTPDGDTAQREAAKVREAIRLARVPMRPILSYLDVDVPSVIPVVDWLGLQCYAHPWDSDESAAARFRSQLARVQGDQPIVLICQAYDRNGTETDVAKVERLQSLWPQLVSEDERIIGLLWFSDGRPGGTRDHPQWRAWHVATLASVPFLQQSACWLTRWW